MELDRRLPRLAAVFGIATLLVIAALMVPKAAQAYTHYWNCNNIGSATQCYDWTGTQYNPWIQVGASVSTSSPNICAKSITAAGNIRSYVGTGWCSSNTTIHITCNNGSTPDSQAYMYWAGTGGNRNLSGQAETLGTQWWC